jgi:hypothetical protein
LAISLNAALQSNYAAIHQWWNRGRVWITKGVQVELQMIAELLLEPEYSPICSGYIGLLVPCKAMHIILSDASYAGMGGWSPHFNLQWRVTWVDLIALGFRMKQIDKYAQEPLDASTNGLHINPLEFLAIIANMWLVMKLIMSLTPVLIGCIIDLLSDNTSAISWMCLTAQTRESSHSLDLPPCCWLSPAAISHVFSPNTFQGTTIWRPTC